MKNAGATDVDITAPLEYRKILFASLRFGRRSDPNFGCYEEAVQLQMALEKQKIKLLIVDAKPGDSISDEVLDCLKLCQGFVAFGW